MSKFAAQGKHGLLLEAEVAPSQQLAFEVRYLQATKRAVKPGTTNHYQSQKNKWGSELRIYFNDPGMAVSLAVSGLHVEYSRKGYRAQTYHFRVSDNDFWWKLVEQHGLRLGDS